jgi:hypothetical protein
MRGGGVGSVRDAVGDIGAVRGLDRDVEAVHAMDGGTCTTHDANRDARAAHGAMMIFEVSATGWGGWADRRDHRTGFKQGVQIIERGRVGAG